MIRAPGRDGHNFPGTKRRVRVARHHQNRHRAAVELVRDQHPDDDAPVGRRQHDGGRTGAEPKALGQRAGAAGAAARARQHQHRSGHRRIGLRVMPVHDDTGCGVEAATYA